MFVMPGVGGADIDRTALAVLSKFNFLPQDRSNSHVFNIPSETIVFEYVFNPSESNGLELKHLAFSGFSIIDISLGNISASIDPLSQLEPLTIEDPLIAFKK
jgi:hypothetical protein